MCSEENYHQLFYQSSSRKRISMVPRNSLDSDEEYTRSSKNPFGPNKEYSSTAPAVSASQKKHVSKPKKTSRRSADRPKNSAPADTALPLPPLLSARELFEDKPGRYDSDSERENSRRTTSASSKRTDSKRENPGPSTSASRKRTDSKRENPGPLTSASRKRTDSERENPEHSTSASRKRTDSDRENPEHSTSASRKRTDSERENPGHSTSASRKRTDSERENLGPSTSASRKRTDSERENPGHSTSASRRRTDSERENLGPSTSASRKRKANVFDESEDEQERVEVVPKRAYSLRSALYCRTDNGDGYTAQQDPTRQGDYYIDLRVYNTQELEDSSDTSRWRNSLISFKSKISKNTEVWRNLKTLIDSAKKDFSGIHQKLRMYRKVNK